MKSAVIVFPGSNCDRDLVVALEKANPNHVAPKMVWHKDHNLPDNLDLIAIPGGFSFGDYLRCGAIAAHSPIMKEVVKFAQNGGYVLGICNGFQILLEAGLLTGTLQRNSDLKFICKDTDLIVKNTSTVYTNFYTENQQITIPIAHHDGSYYASDDQISHLKDNDLIAFEYVDNPNGSTQNIAGILSKNKRILGMMPHPERLNDPLLGGTDGSTLFESIMAPITKV